MISSSASPSIDLCLHQARLSVAEQVIHAVSQVGPHIQTIPVDAVFAPTDRAETDDFGQAADGFEQVATTRAQITDVVGEPGRTEETGLAGDAFAVGHHAPFRSVSAHHT